jgi:methylated-DNA-[protein]-cysteine S-methyltransferase
MNETEQEKAMGSLRVLRTETRMRAGEIERAVRKGVRSHVAKGEPTLVGARRAAARLADAAVREGLLDVAYGFADSPFGRLMVAVTPRGLVRLDYPDRDLDESLQELASELSPRILEAPKATDQVRRELDEYFAGTRREFSVPVDMSPLLGFRRRVLEQTARIPYGSVSTYAEVAQRAGSPRGMRAAGNALGSNPIPIVVPCHRVLRSGGGLGGYTGGLDRKVTLLQLEGALEG